MFAKLLTLDLPDPSRLVQRTETKYGVCNILGTSGRCVGYALFLDVLENRFRVQGFREARLQYQPVHSADAMCWFFSLTVTQIDRQFHLSTVDP